MEQTPTLNDFISLAVAREPRQNHQGLFLLARGIRLLEEREGRRWSEDELFDVVDRWYARSRFVRHEVSVYFAEFMAAYGNVRAPWGSCRIVDLAWEASAQAPVVPEVPERYGKDLARLARWCRALQQLRDKPFYLSTEDVRKRLTPAIKDRTPASNLLKTLMQFRVITLIEKGRFPRRASTYQYLLSLDNALGTTGEGGAD